MIWAIITTRFGRRWNAHYKTTRHSIWNCRGTFLNLLTGPPDRQFAIATFRPFLDSRRTFVQPALGPRSEDFSKVLEKQLAQTGTEVEYFTRFKAKCDDDVATAWCVSIPCISSRS